MEYKIKYILNIRYTWRIDLAKSEEFWSGWFSGLSQMFLELRVPKLLLLASIDGLDRTLTVGQMQGSSFHLSIKKINPSHSFYILNQANSKCKCSPAAAMSFTRIVRTRWPRWSPRIWCATNLHNPPDRFTVKCPPARAYICRSNMRKFWGAFFFYSPHQLWCSFQIL